MKIYKFGGASVKDADGVRNLARIVAEENDRLFVVVSAMGKTTNALERMLEAFYDGNREAAEQLLREVSAYHDSIIAELWEADTIPEHVSKLYEELEQILELNPVSRDYEVWYDRIVGYGELLSSTIISEFLNRSGIRNRWIDMREVFITTSRHRDANIDIERSAPLLKGIVDSSDAPLFIAQGFIGATEDGAPTTIGREGSDYSAAVAGYILDAESVAIWKDVKGILNGDPKLFEDTTHIPELTYLDAIELAYSGAQIIHPKTIKPLQNKNIPLHVRCFLDSGGPGSVIKESIGGTIDIPIFILKHSQVLMTIRPHDFSFVLEERLAQIFTLLEEHQAKVNLIQNSAVDLSICIDSTRYLDDIVAALNEQEFRASYNTGMELLTVRGYTPEQVAAFSEGPDVYLMQRTRRTLRIVRRATEK